MDYSGYTEQHDYCLQQPWQTNSDASATVGSWSSMNGGLRPPEPQAQGSSDTKKLTIAKKTSLHRRCRLLLQTLWRDCRPRRRRLEFVELRRISTAKSSTDQSRRRHFCTVAVAFFRRNHSKIDLFKCCFIYIHYNEVLTLNCNSSTCTYST